MSWLVIVVLAVVWAIFLVPQIVRARRRREEVLPPLSVVDRVVVERRQPGWLMPLLGLAGTALGVDALVQRDLVGLAAAAALLGIGVLMWRRRGAGPAAIADATGLDLPGRGRLAWDEIECLVPLGSQFQIVARGGASPMNAGRVDRWLRRLDDAATGYEVWGLLPAIGVEPGQAELLLAFVTAAGIPVVEPRPRAGGKVVRLIVWLLAP
ncbi:MAG: hypothetical protein JWN67_4805 [Actinomycetia bacterium]|nr:hypothetical protein [Actinomycetes bacterium]